MTTGVPSDVTLKSSGGLVITTPGTVVEGLDIHGSVTIAADNVTLKNCKISDSSYDTVLIKPGVSGAVVQNCDIDNQGSGGQALAGQGTFLNNNIHGAADGIDVRGSNTVIKDNFIHDLQGTSSSHYDGIQADGNFSNVSITHNTVINDHGQTSALMLSNYWGPISNTKIDDNLLVGGGYTVYLDEVAQGQPGGGTITGLSFTNNHLGTGQYGTMDLRTELGDQPTISGNVNDGAAMVQSLHMTGQPSSDGSTSVSSSDPGSATTGSGSSTTDGSGTSASGTGSTSTSHDSGTSTSDGSGASTSGSGTSASGTGSTSTSHDPGSSTTDGSGTSASGAGSTSTSHDSGTSTSDGSGASTSGSGTSASGAGSTSTSHDPGSSTTDGSGTSASGAGSTSTSHDPGTSMSHDPGSSTSTGSGTQGSSSTDSSTSSHQGSGTSGSTSGHHSTSGSGSNHHWHHQSSDSASTLQLSGTASDPTTNQNHSGSGQNGSHSWHGWNHDCFNFGSHNWGQAAQNSHSSGSHQDLAQASKNIYDHFADALNHASQAAHHTTHAAISGDTMTFKHGNATQHHDMHLA